MVYLQSHSIVSDRVVIISLAIGLPSFPIVTVVKYGCSRCNVTVGKVAWDTGDLVFEVIYSAVERGDVLPVDGDEAVSANAVMFVPESQVEHHSMQHNLLQLQEEEEVCLFVWLIGLFEKKLVLLQYNISLRVKPENRLCDYKLLSQELAASPGQTFSASYSFWLGYDSFGEFGSVEIRIFKKELKDNNLKVKI